MAFTPQPTEIDGHVITATCSGAPGSDPAFKFFAKRGTTNNVVVFFDGGGACWSDASCARPGLATTPPDGDWLYKAEILARDNPATARGIFDLSDARNPVRDWSFVFVPYCTGDVHTGSNTATYHNPQTGAAYIIQHRGADNFRLILEWMRANFNTPGEILVTGSSAGAYGASGHFARIRDAFPNGRAVMLGDAGQGVIAPGFNTARADTWGYTLPPQVYGANTTPTGNEDIVGDLAAHYPHDRFAQYTTAHDRTQTAFFALMGVHNACGAWTQSMSQALTAREHAANFRAYLAAGDTHTILRSPLFYAEQSGGEPFYQWFAELLGDGAANRECQNCLAPPAQCPF